MRDYQVSSHSLTRLFPTPRPPHTSHPFPGTRPEKIRIQKWYTVYKDHITLADYEISEVRLFGWEDGFLAGEGWGRESAGVDGWEEGFALSLCKARNAAVYSS